MQKTSTRFAAWLFAASLPALLAGCGGDGSGGTPGASAPSQSGPAAAPTIQLSGTPPTSAVAGSTYSFQPTVVISKGTAKFSASGLPGWASLNASTGAISGTPTASYVGTSATITLSASDGGASASLPAFTVSVTAPAPVTGSATLMWVAPTVNTDGTPITDLAGYHIHYGTNAAALSSEVVVPSPGTTSYEISNLSAGTYYFTVTAYNSLGVESGASTEASKTI